MNQKPFLPKVTFREVRNIILITILVSFTATASYLFGRQGFEADLRTFPRVTVSRQTPPARDLDFSLFWKVWDTLDAKYYDKSKLNRSKMVYGAIKGMVEAVGDPYTAFLPPEENQITQADLLGSFEGVGIEIGFKGTQLVVISPLPDTPAENAGIKAGDYIIGIKDERKGIDMGTVGISLPDAVEAIRGPKGTEVTLLLLRNGSDTPLEIKVTRDAIDVPSVTVDFLDTPKGKVAHLKLMKFGGETTAEWGKAVSEISRNKDVQGVILDLRGNPGGYLDGAVYIAGEFLKDGVVVVEDDGRGGKKEIGVEDVERTGSLLNSTPLVVLVNKGSASASEILAGALKDHNRAKIVGTTTFGKGTIQVPQQINGGSGLHITIAKWLTPNGFWVNDKGLTPDYVIENDDTAEGDEQLAKAIEVLQGQ